MLCVQQRAQNRYCMVAIQSQDRLSTHWQLQLLGSYLHMSRDHSWAKSEALSLHSRGSAPACARNLLFSSIADMIQGSEQAEVAILSLFDGVSPTDDSVPLAVAMLQSASGVDNIHRP